jgi:general secretion pathway protein D
MTTRPLRWEADRRRAARRAGALLLALAASFLPFSAIAQNGSPADATAPTTLGDSSQRDAILLNFEGADIREVIYTFAAALSLNYWLDPRVQGQVTARSFGPIYVDDLYPVFLQILRSNGYAAVREGDLYMIVPAEDGKTRAMLRSRDKSEDFVIELVKVEHVSAERIVELLNPFVSPGGDVVAYARNNLVIISDLASNAKRMRELVQTFDNDTFEDMQGKVYRINHAAVEEIAEELLTVLESYQIVDSGARMQLIPLVRLNSLAVIAFDAAVFANVEYWLDVLDVPGEGGSERRVYVYRVENSRALELSEVLNEVYAGLADEVEGAGGGRSGALAERGVGLGGGLDQQRRRGGRQQAQEQQALSGLALPGSPVADGLAGTLFEQEVRIVADELTNSLVILATPRDYGMIRSVLSELDIVPRQVLVEMLIAEITLGNDIDLGITHRLGADVRNPDDTGGGGGGGGDSTPGDMMRMLPGVGGLLVGNPAAAGANRVDGTFGGSGLDMMFTNVAGDYQVTLTALSQESELKILSRPHIMTADNQEARILVGAEIPIVTSQGSANQQINGSSNVLQQVQYRDTGVVVQVTPQVNSQGLINMTVSQEVSEIAGADLQVAGIDSPSFTTREAETTVVVQSGETIIIGGIIQETKTEARSGVPYLMDIPVLGQLFRATSYEKRRTELIILITPYVVRSRDEASSVTEQFRNRVDSLLRDLNIEDESAQDDTHTVILQKPSS